mmetsp:Transcript_27340/g.50399  ORF Transcript_27340/g.50399 Transcript_27340/m.50399 type:complete len:222 (+) Transcript_27340:265-930(+)
MVLVIIVISLLVIWCIITTPLGMWSLTLCKCMGILPQITNNNNINNNIKKETKKTTTSNFQFPTSNSRTRTTNPTNSSHCLRHMYDNRFQGPWRCRRATARCFTSSPSESPSPPRGGSKTEMGRSRSHRSGRGIMLHSTQRVGERRRRRAGNWNRNWHATITAATATTAAAAAAAATSTSGTIPPTSRQPRRRPSSARRAMRSPPSSSFFSFSFSFSSSCS